MNGNLNFLTAATNSAALEQSLNEPETVGKYLSSITNETIFDRIDVILPSNLAITQEGKLTERGGQSAYEQLKAKGTHVTGRLISSFTNEKVVCCVTPIICDDDEIIGLLVGTINCSALGDL